jgi:hypothetical protein
VRVLDNRNRDSAGPALVPQCVSDHDVIRTDSPHKHANDQNPLVAAKVGKFTTFSWPKLYCLPLTMRSRRGNYVDLLGSVLQPEWLASWRIINAITDCGLPVCCCLLHRYPSAGISDCGPYNDNHLLAGVLTVQLDINLDPKRTHKPNLTYGEQTRQYWAETDFTLSPSRRLTNLWKTVKQLGTMTKAKSVRSVNTTMRYWVKSVHYPN